MSFLAPWYLPVMAAAATVPPLVLLYFLKLKRREVPVASTLLWRRAVEDLQVNSPFQRLRNSLLLILQLLVLAAAALAIAEPMLSGHRGFEKAVVLMIDHSASMAAREGDATRLELARRAASDIINDLSTAQRAMIIAFADRARVLCPFTDDKAALRQAVQSIVQTDAPGRLTEAMALAEAHSTPIGEVGREFDVAESQYVVLTDGRLADAAATVVRRGTLEVIRIGSGTDNVGIVNLDARRHYERPEQITVLARVKNFGTRPATRDVSIYIDDDLKAVQTVSLAALGDDTKVTRQSIGEPSIEAEANVTFDLTLDTAARVELRLSGHDDFSADDRAVALVTAPRPVSVLLVTPGNRYLRLL
ncbi:MAG: BatA domain-containing protein, partial [Phycisphaerae bacterium]